MSLALCFNTCSLKYQCITANRIVNSETFSHRNVCLAVQKFTVAFLGVNAQRLHVCAHVIRDKDVQLCSREFWRHTGVAAVRTAI